MKLKAREVQKWKLLPLTALLTAAIVSVPGSFKQNALAVTATTPQLTFATPAEAGQALQAANRADDDSALAQILGRQSKLILSSGDPTEDKAAAQSFVVKFDRMNRWAAMTDGTQVLYIGADNYPFPIPLARDASSRWHFNTAAGEDEMLARRIGRNELLAIDACTSLANAEELYRRTPHEGSASQYTPYILSNPGKQDGLHWEVGDSEAPSPLGKLGNFAKAAGSSATPEGSPVFDGYSFRILAAQGSAAKGGSKNYLVNGKLIGGFAVIAQPVKYQDSGIMTFILSREGVVYQKDLGEKTSELAAAIHSYNPGEGWTPAE